MNKSWIESVLDRNLHPVAAPAELWDRVRNPRPRPVLQWKLAFALVVAVATAWALHPRTASIQSESARDVREWVKARTGLDVPLSPAAPIRLCGSSVFGNGSAEIRYRVRNREAAMLVAKAERYTSTHRFVSHNTWILRGQSYTVASADLQTACLLCHIDPPPAVN